MKTFFFYLYAIFLSLWTGGIFVFTFVITPVIFRSYPRDTAGDIVGRLFPSYFFFCLIIAGLSFGAFLLSRFDSTTLGYKLSLALISIAIASALYVNFGLHPRMQKVKAEVASFEAESPDAPARRSFRRLHAASAVLNLFLLAEGVALIVVSLRLTKNIKQ